MDYSQTIVYIRNNSLHINVVEPYELWLVVATVSFTQFMIQRSLWIDCRLPCLLEFAA